MQSSRNIVRLLSRNAVPSSVGPTPAKNLKPWQEIPGLKSLPIVKQLFHFLPGGVLSNTDVVKMCEMFYKTYGPIVKIDGLFGKPDLLFLLEPDGIETVLRNENSMPVRSGFESIEYFRKKYNKSEEESKKPTGLITDHLDNWKYIRMKVNPILMQPKTIKLYQPVLEEVAEDMVKRMKSIRNAENKIEAPFYIEMNKWALESIGVVALGGRIGCLEQSLPEDSPARQMIQCVFDIFKMSDKLDFKPSLWRYYSTRNFKKAMRIYQQQLDLSKHFIQKAIAEMHANKTQKSDEQKGVLEKLLDIDENIAYIMASDMLFAGVDTAATSMIGALYLLGSNPDKQSKLREEIMSNKEKRPYLKACLKESQRMLPVVPGNLRQATRDYELYGYLIPKGMNMTFAHQYLCMLDSQYPRPREFIPERWLTNKEDPLYYGNAHPFAYSPFGFGVRMCVGRRIAELEIETFLSKIIENFEVEWFGPPPKTTVTSINYILGPYNFKFKDIK